jgi:hypothetical protein
VDALARVRVEPLDLGGERARPAAHPDLRVDVAADLVLAVDVVLAALDDLGAHVLEAPDRDPLHVVAQVEDRLQLGGVGDALVGGDRALVEDVALALVADGARAGARARPVPLHVVPHEPLELGRELRRGREVTRDDVDCLAH